MVCSNGEDSSRIRRPFPKMTQNNNSPSESQTLAGLYLPDPDVLECPICTESLTIPLFQCENGHLACASCCNKIRNKCHSCTLPTGRIRCIGMEKVIESVKISCQNMQHGCLDKISFCKKLEHLKTCKYNPTTCPSTGCKYIGTRHDLFLHLIDKQRLSCEIILLDHVKSFPVCSDTRLVFILDAVEHSIFSLNRVIDPLGSFVNVCAPPFASATSDVKFSYDLTARKQEKSINWKTSMEVSPKWSEQPSKEKCFLIPNDLHHGSDKLFLELIVRRVS